MRCAVCQREEGSRCRVATVSEARQASRGRVAKGIWWTVTQLGSFELRLDILMLRQTSHGNQKRIPMRTSQIWVQHYEAVTKRN